MSPDFYVVFVVLSYSQPSLEINTAQPSSPNCAPHSGLLSPITKAEAVYKSRGTLERCGSKPRATAMARSGCSRTRVFSPISGGQSGFFAAITNDKGRATKAVPKDETDSAENVGNDRMTRISLRVYPEIAKHFHVR